MCPEQVRMYLKLHPSLYFQYHVGSRIIISLVVLSLGWSRGRHIDSRLKDRNEDGMSNVSVSAHCRSQGVRIGRHGDLHLDTGTLDCLGSLLRIG